LTHEDLNPSYSQREGREELFERDRHKELVAGWHGRAIACAGGGSELTMSEIVRCRIGGKAARR